MNQDHNFKLIDVEHWARKPYFEYYLKKVKCTYSMTVLVNIEALLIACRKHEVKLYPAMIYILSRSVNQIEELRIDYDAEGRLGIWGHRLPSYTLFHQDDKTFSSIWTPYHSSFSVFHRGYLEDIKYYGQNKSFVAKEEEPTNIFYISCIPWVNFTGFNLNIYDKGDCLAPIFTIGQYHQYDNKTVIPISAQLHHAICDGYHAGLLFDEIKKLAGDPDTWIAQR